MKLITQKILEQFAKQGDTSQKSTSEIIVYLKIFNPYGAQTWFIYEYDPESEIAWCFADLGDKEMAELGTVSMAEIKQVKVPPFGFPLERDKFWKPCPLSEILKEYEK